MNPENKDSEPPKVTAAPIEPAGDVASSPTLCRLDSLIEQLGEYAQIRFDARLDGRNFGPVTPFPKLTEQFGGAIPEGTHIIMGGSGVGKTALALQIASECQCPCLYVSCEMKALELLRRSAARVTRTSLEKFKDGTLTGAAVKGKATQAALRSPMLAIADATSRPARIEWIAKVAEAQRAESPYYMIVIDSLHSWAEGNNQGQPEYELISLACKGLRELAAVLGCPILVISEMSRSAQEKAEKGKENTGGGAGSRKIEYGAESVIQLARSEEQDNRVTGDKRILLSFEKNRNGAGGKAIPLIFEGGFQNYREA
jgi:replicative DNA helicase